MLGAEESPSARPVQTGRWSSTPTSSPATPPTGCGVVRQIHYSSGNENSIDLVLFLNGVPVATAELKTDFTQSVGDAIDQYRFDRPPHPKGQPSEPLLSFPNGALVHFAVSNDEVHMATKLGRPGDPVSCPSTRATTERKATRRTRGAATARPTFGRRCVGARQLAGDPRTLHHRPAATQKKADREDHLPPLPPARRDAQAPGCRPQGRGGREVSRSALGGLGQDELHRLDGALPGGAARRGAQKKSSTPCWWSRTAP